MNLIGLMLVFWYGGGWKSHATLAKGIDNLNKWSDFWHPRNRGSVPINLQNLIVRIRHPALHGAIYLHQKTGFARHPVKGKYHWKQ